MAVTLESLLTAGKVALVLVEIQERTLSDTTPWPDLANAAKAVNLVPNVARLADTARAHKAPVIHCTAEYQHDLFGLNGNARLFASARKRITGPEPKLDAPLGAVWKDGDIILPRYHGVSPMTGTPLDSMLRNQGITTLILTGVSVSFAILNTTFDAVNRSYQVIIPHDGVAGFPADYVPMVMQNTLSMLATIAPTDAIVKAWRA